ncbi:MAG TPA: N-acetylornithine carbamoyltransferase [Steroidobacteraceae bacterium]|jgi:N-acetylornithine carbamoyltransferase|nr:N-acetylornithine carbamoyltransferase [Steroidobacteraceae bacterium]
MPSSITAPRFIDLADFSPGEIARLLALAARLERSPEPHALAGRILGLLFLNPSLRTLASCQAAMARLGGSSFVITPGAGTWQLETREGAVMDGTVAEHIREGLPVLASYCDALGIRSFADGRDLAADLGEQKFSAMARLIDKPLVNLESAANHPCQALADWKTLDELDVPREGKLVLSWAYHPRALPLAVPAATVHMAAMRGMRVTVLRPEGYALPREILEKARRAGGGAVEETSDVRHAMQDADVVYVKEWANTAHYGNEAADAEARGALKHWCLNEDWFAAAPRGCRLMHCLPVRRNVAVADGLLDGPRSVVQRQAYNRLPAQMAVLYQLLKPAEAAAERGSSPS